MTRRRQGPNCGDAAQLPLITRLIVGATAIDARPGTMDLDFEIHAGPGSGTRGQKRSRDADDDLKGPWMPEEDAVLTRLVAVRAAS